MQVSLAANADGLGFVPSVSLIPILNVHCILAGAIDRGVQVNARSCLPVQLREQRSTLGRRCTATSLHQLKKDAEGLSVDEATTLSCQNVRRGVMTRRAFGAISLPVLTGLAQTSSVEAAVDAEKEARLMQRSGSGAADSAEFYQKWRYAAPADILPYIFANAREGQVDEILDAMDEFGLRYPMYKLGHEKGLILEQELSQIQPKPKVALELGTFLGYSAMRTARFLGPEGKLTCIEYNPEHSEVAEKLIAYAGLGDRVKVITGASSEVLPDLWDFGKADFVLLDHKKSLYLPDLLTMEKLGIIKSGTVVAADNVIYPGAPDFLDHVQKGPMYSTRIRDAAFEYDLKWMQGWESKADGISFSVRQ